jgi:hypothetical protein
MPRRLDLEFTGSLPFCTGDTQKIKKPIYLILFDNKVNLFNINLDFFNFYEYII